MKFFEITGVPPVQRGVLMYYNMSDLDDFKTRNYVLDLEVGRRYHKNFDLYPLPLDLGLPLYRQARVFRYGNLVGLIGTDDLNYDLMELRHFNEQKIYSVTEGHYAGGRFLYPGDQLKIDLVQFEDLLSAAKSLKPLMSPGEIIFFETRSTQYFRPELLRRVVGIFGE